jgi:probable rRNA maturation factor
MPKSSTPPVWFHFLRPFHLAERNALKAFIVKMFRKEQTELGEVRFIFCSDPYLLDINRQYLQHDYFTDIITFNLSEKGEPVRGEIYISVDRVKENAKTLGVFFKEEMHRVIFHGILHLCGYKDKKPAEIRQMRAKEDEYLAQYF